MANPFYNALMGINPMIAGMQNLYAMLPQFKANPMGFILRKKMNIPNNIANNPDAILQHLVSTGQVDPSRVEAAKQELIKMGGFNNNGR